LTNRTTAELLPLELLPDVREHGLDDKRKYPKIQNNYDKELSRD